MVGSERRRGPRGGRRRIALGPPRHLHRAGGAAGLAHAVIDRARTSSRGQPFLMYLGDNVLLEGLSAVRARSSSGPRPTRRSSWRACPSREHFGVAVLEGDRVVRLVEKPKEFVPTSRSSASTCSTTRSSRRARRCEPSWRGEYEITEAIQWLIDHGRTVRAEMVSGWWKDTGKPEDLLEANRMMLSRADARAIDGEVDAASTSRARSSSAPARRSPRSTLRGPVVIGAGSVVDGLDLGPDVSIERGCRVIGRSRSRTRS